MESSQQQMKSVRRVVTGHDAKGKAIVLFDSAMPARQRKAANVASTLLWITDESPADISGGADRVREIGIPPPPEGSIFRVVDFLPEADVGKIDGAALREMGAQLHAGARHPMMHRTKSIDYAVVLQGEIDMLLDDSEVHLKAGDVVVQQGTNHAWANRGRETCRIAFILIDAKEP